MDKYNEALQRYNTNLNDEVVKQEVEQILHKNLLKYSNPDVYKFLFGCIDLTSLNTTDTAQHITNFTKRVNDFENEHPEMNNVAAICVYPNMAGTVRMNLEVSDVNIAAVSAGFPSSQTFTEVKVAETALAVADGADEIDIVINVGNFLAEEYEDMCDEIEEIKHSCKNAHLKVILETGALGNSSNVKKAALLAIYSGADFIKTSTGKLTPGATPEAFYVMCTAIKEYYEHTHTRIGIKAAGGISTTADAVKYYTIAKSVLGEEWLDKKYFRIGASRLATNLLESIVSAGKN